MFNYFWPLPGSADTTTFEYDPLDRLKQAIDPLAGQTQYGYTPLDQLASVTDPRNLITSYALNGLDELTQQLSPDTGTTTNTFDGAGNVLTATYTYDALNRVTSVAYPDQTIAYTYDQGANGKGRLTGITDSTGSTTFTYDVHGRLTQDARLIGGVAYTTAYRYNSAGQRDRVTYPSGTVVEFSFDAPGRISGITATPAGGSAQVLVTGAAYHPAGALKGFTHGNGSSYARSVDRDGRISAHTLGAGTRTITWDAASRLSALTGPSPGLDQSLGYDALDRLTDWVSSASSQGYAYDAAGNRTQLTIGASSYPYTVSGTSNRLTQTAGPGGSKSFGYDASGHTTALGLLTFAYDARGRMVEAVNGSLTATYQVNALGQRVVKSLSPGATTHYHYDAEGRLIAESDATGTPEREYVWLDDTPVALITHPDRAVYFLQPDHLDTPRVLTNAANGIVWRWDSDPFGVSPPDQDPDGDSNPFIFNLRLPGQYYDAETGLHYNYYRDYDPQTGRYIQSDPIGLRGGINTYGYVSARPLERIDPLGLFLTSVDAACVQNPELCAEITGQIVENAGNLSGEPCTEAAAQSAGEAIRTLGTAAILTGVVKGVTRGGGAFAGIREASQVLQSAGVPRAARVQILQSFEAGTVSVGQAGARQFGIRFFGRKADQAGRFLFDTFPASRQSLALRPEFNAMTGFRQFQIRPGATVISGRAASQGVRFEGGQIQRFILDPATDLLP